MCTLTREARPNEQGGQAQRVMRCTTRIVGAAGQEGLTSFRRSQVATLS